MPAAPSSAQAPGQQQETVHFGTYENDSFFDSDRFYTNGVQLSIKRSRDQRGDFASGLTGRACGWFGCEDSTLLTSQTNYGQLMYTPATSRRARPSPKTARGAACCTSSRPTRCCRPTSAP